MTKQEVLKLKTGDMVTCTMCPPHCTGRPVRVRVQRWPCGCVAYTHEGNHQSFFFIPSKACKEKTPLVADGWTWTDEYSGYPQAVENRIKVNPRLISRVAYRKE